MSDYICMNCRMPCGIKEESYTSINDEDEELEESITTERKLKKQKVTASDCCGAAYEEGE